MRSTRKTSKGQAKPKQPKTESALCRPIEPLAAAQAAAYFKCDTSTSHFPIPSAIRFERLQNGSLLLDRFHLLSQEWSGRARTVRSRNARRPPIVALSCDHLRRRLSASAQVFTGRVDVTVEDTTGGRLPGVNVDLTGPVNQTQVTDTQGQAHFLNLPVGTDSIKTSLAGFNRSRTTACR